jgi:hypothetical protein
MGNLGGRGGHMSLVTMQRMGALTPTLNPLILLNHRTFVMLFLRNNAAYIKTNSNHYQLENICTN